MIAADTSSLIAFFAGEPGRDTDAIEAALASGALRLPPVVVAEILSGANIPADFESWLADVARLDIGPGYWERVGHMRRRLLKIGRRPALADCLICQTCLDYDVPLITRDTDFRIHARHFSLKLV